VRWWDGHAWTAATNDPQSNDAPPNRAPPNQPPSPIGGKGRPDRAPDSGRPTFPLRSAWLALAGAVAGLLFLSGVLQLVATALFPGSVAAQILFGEVGIWVGLGGTCVLASRRFGTGSVVRDFGWRIRLADLGIGPAAALGCLLAAGIITSAFQRTVFAGSNTDIITSQKGNTVGVAIVTLVAALGAPVFEELFFRGLLRQALASRLGVGAVWVQALFFGLAHYQPMIGLGNVSVMAGTAGVGLVLGYTTYLTGRLGADTIAHGMFNLFVTLTIIGVIR
jgi:uncharacterized protein